MNLTTHIITSDASFREITSTWNGLIACDTETYGKVWDVENRKLLGISMSPENLFTAIYVPIWVWDQGTWREVADAQLKVTLSIFLENSKLVGHNFTYDKRWIEETLPCKTSWIADTRIMWHLASAPSGPRPYGLKDAQTEVLKWNKTNEEELDKNVRAKGGLLRNGDHYMADVEILAKYAGLDAYSTIQLYKSLKPFFDTHSYWPLLSDMMAYNELLEANTYLGVPCDKEGLERALESIIGDKEKALKSFMKSVSSQIEELELDWVDRKCAGYKREYNKTNYVNTPTKWKRFNLNSDSDKRELFYGKLRFPITEKTEGGLPSTSADVLKGYKHAGLEEYLKYEKLNTLASNFVGPYLDSLDNDNKLHPGFNICGTVSYRLSGFKPYLLNAPFDEKRIMQHMRCEEGYIGIHADLSAIEPSITAHYSEDPSLLKVFREGLGDIYLDLALDLFPEDKELQNGYNPAIRISADVKKRFEKQRKIAKVIQLAVQYTGTGHTVSKNLTKQGMPTSFYKAEYYVRQYWSKFRKVAEFNSRLREVYRNEGLLRNVIGRIIRVPNPDYKDLPNRFIQSSAHDVLVLWVLEIYRMAKERGITIRPMLLDCHDSTSNAFREADIEAAKSIYNESLAKVNLHLGLSCPAKAETKIFRTFAGLKNDEEE